MAVIELPIIYASYCLELLRIRVNEIIIPPTVPRGYEMCSVVRKKLQVMKI
jgi:hypothetical protein